MNNEARVVDLEGLKKKLTWEISILVLPAFAASSAEVVNGLSHTSFFLCAPQTCHVATFIFTAVFF